MDFFRAERQRELPVQETVLLEKRDGVLVRQLSRGGDEIAGGLPGQRPLQTVHQFAGVLQDSISVQDFDSPRVDLFINVTDGEKSTVASPGYSGQAVVRVGFSCDAWFRFGRTFAFGAVELRFLLAPADGYELLLTELR